MDSKILEEIVQKYDLNRVFWLIISNISQYYTKHHPKKAFHLLCVKDAFPKLQS